MDAEIVMPRMGLTMEEGTLLRWLKRAGDSISNGEDLFEIETDKSNVLVQAMQDGVLGEILVAEGETVPIGTVVALYAGQNAVPVHTPARVTTVAAAPVASTSVTEPPQTPVTGTRVKASPAARRLAFDLDVDLARVNGTGPNGRIVMWNVQDAIQPKPLDAPKPSEVPQPAKVSPVAQRVARELGVDLLQVQGTGVRGQITREDVERAAQVVTATQLESVSPTTTQPNMNPVTRVSNVHRVMATRMAASFSTAPHFYLHAQVKARALMAMRAGLLARLQERAQVHLTYTDLLIQLSARALREHPEMCAQWIDEGLRPQSEIHIGVAVEAPGGLFVPVLHNAAQHGLADIARWRMDAIEKAREGKLLPSDFEGGVFTISNLGKYRVDWFEAILNPPQAAILAVGRIAEQPIVEQGQVVAAPMLNLSLSVDHRVVDGAKAARFLTDLAELVENPALALT